MRVELRRDLTASVMASKHTPEPQDCNEFQDLVALFLSWVTRRSEMQRKETARDSRGRYSRRRDRDLPRTHQGSASGFGGGRKSKSPSLTRPNNGETRTGH